MECVTFLWKPTNGWFWNLLYQQFTRRRRGNFTGRFPDLSLNVLKKREHWQSTFEHALVVNVLQPFGETLKRLAQIPTAKQIAQPLA